MNDTNWQVGTLLYPSIVTHSEKYGNDNPSAVRSETSSFALKSDSGQSTVGMEVVNNPPSVQSQQMIQPMHTDPVIGELPPLVTPPDLQGNYPLPPFGVSESSQTGLFHEVV